MSKMIKYCNQLGKNMITYQIFKIYYWKNKTKLMMMMMMMIQLRINIINLFIKKGNLKLKKTKNKIKNLNIAIYNNPLPKNLLQYSIELLI